MDDNFHIDARNLLFFDIETTGLSGGSGTVPFLIGCGSVTETGFQIRQYFLPDYPDEAAMLEAVRAEINEWTILVTYNGKAFDLPILRDRLVLYRIERHLEPGGHIDLLHPVRRVYRRRLRDCTLGNIERAVLEFFRIDDIPGFMVPAVYFNWLATAQTGEIARVVRHNLNDIISLYFILHHLSELLKNPSEKVRDPEDIHSLARLFEQSGDYGNLLAMFENMNDFLNREKRADLLYLYSLACKRTGDLTRAVGIWEKMIAIGPEAAFWARIELAKYFEHRTKDHAEALRHARAAREDMPSFVHHTSDLERRIARLQRKLMK